MRSILLARAASGKAERSRQPLQRELALKTGTTPSTLQQLQHVCRQGCCKHRSWLTVASQHLLPAPAAGLPLQQKWIEHRSRQQGAQDKLLTAQWLTASQRPDTPSRRGAALLSGSEPCWWLRERPACCLLRLTRGVLRCERPEVCCGARMQPGCCQALRPAAQTTRQVFGSWPGVQPPCCQAAQWIAAEHSSMQAGWPRL